MKKLKKKFFFNRRRKKKKKIKNFSVIIDGWTEAGGDDVPKRPFIKVRSFVTHVP